MKHEVYQVYNPQQKQFVKMRNGRILENSYFQFEGVPLFGEGKKKEPSQALASEKSNTSLKPEQNEPAEDKAEVEPVNDEPDKEDGMGFMGYF
ncbi:MAG TPA: hypothetical protein VFG39_01460 [Balneolaceae bacterium]|nr:hypothetical protein [Balneolaceae bacterium]